MGEKLMANVWKGEQLQTVAEECYIYGYSLVLMDIMRRIHTAVPLPTAHGAPTNCFWHSNYLADLQLGPEPRPHADSLRSTAWLDLTQQPMILEIPSTDRYFLLSLFSTWGDLFESVSPRTHGSEHTQVVLTGPQWHGVLPENVRSIVTPTDRIWINGRIQASGSENLQIVHRIQDQFRLTALPDCDRPEPVRTGPFRTDIDRQLTPAEQVERLEAPAFFSRLAQLMQRTPPPERDTAAVERFGGLGFVANPLFVFDHLPSPVRIAMNAAVASARTAILQASRTPAMTVNNWEVWVHPRHDESNYLRRAAAARNAFRSSLAEDVVAFHTEKDAAGEELRGSNEYVIHFEEKHIHPAKAFWSITVYDQKRALAANAIHRYTLGDCDRLRINSDNSYSIYVQHSWPGASKDSNWLPVPRNTFELVLQLYWPKEEVLTGMWRPPAVTRVH